MNKYMIVILLLEIKIGTGIKAKGDYKNTDNIR